MHEFILVLDLIRSLRLYFIWLSFLGFSVFLFPREYFLFSRQYVEALNRPIWFVNPTSPIGRVNQCRAIQQSRRLTFLSWARLSLFESSIRSQGNMTDLLVIIKQFISSKKKPIGIWPQHVNLVPPTRERVMSGYSSQI